MPADARRGLTPTGWRLVVAVTALSIAHHVDHVLREVTGWPLAGGFNAFSVSLFVYPVIAAGLFLSGRGQAGSRFWALLAGGGSLFVMAVHIGPSAGDSVTSIPDQHRSAVADVVALAVLAAFVAALVGHCLYETRRLVGAARR